MRNKSNIHFIDTETEFKGLSKGGIKGIILSHIIGIMRLYRKVDVTGKFIKTPSGEKTFVEKDTRKDIIRAVEGLSDIIIAIEDTDYVNDLKRLWLWYYEKLDYLKESGLANRKNILKLNFIFSRMRFRVMCKLANRQGVTEATISDISVISHPEEETQEDNG